MTDTYRTAAESAKAIRQALKAEHGWTSRDISVRSENYSMGSSVDLKIKRAGIDPETVTRIANAESYIRYDERTGEILGGGNRFVFVDFDHKLERQVTEPLERLLEALPDGERRPIVAGVTVRREDRMFYIDLPNGGDWSDMYATAAAHRIGRHMLATWPEAVEIVGVVAS